MLAVLLTLFVSAAATSAPARRIVTLAPSLTELVYAAGAGERLVGVDTYSDYPAAARKVARIGDAFLVDYERVLTLKPDLVLAWMTGTPEPTIDRLRALGLRVERIGISGLDEIPAALKKVGALTGTQPVAERAAQEYLNRLTSLRSGRGQAKPLSVFYQISEKPLYTVNGRHLISEVIALCGGRNVFAGLQQLAPPVSAEAVLERDPEVILAGTGAQGDPLSVWRRWPKMRAVRDGNLYMVHADVLARPTPRVLDGVKEVCGVLDKIRARTEPRR